MNIEIKYNGIIGIKGELVGEDNQPIYNEDGTLAYIRRSLNIVPDKDNNEPLVVSTKDK